MMKLHISVWREVTSLVPVINKNLAEFKPTRRFAEAPFIGAPTESPFKKVKVMKIKSFACAATVAAQASTQDAGMFVTSHATGTPAQAEFNTFTVTTP